MMISPNKEIVRGKQNAFATSGGDSGYCSSLLLPAEETNLSIAGVDLWT
jgi:hypothetical protein